MTRCSNGQCRDVRRFKNRTITTCLSCGRHEIKPRPRYGAAANPQRRVFRYRYLSPLGQIRLIKLHPGKWHDDLSCDIIHTWLGSFADYEAVSYTWANKNKDASLCQRLYVGNEESYLVITENCMAALKQFRLETMERRLWVDAICINQLHKRERSRQVAMMTKIYKTARQILIFIGPGKDTEMIQHLFQYISDRTCDNQHFECPKQYQRNHEHKSLETLLLSSRNETVAYAKNLLLYSHKEAEIYAEEMPRFLREFLQQRWFFRIWVLQEVVMARSATVFWQSVPIDWEKLTVEPFEASDISRPHILDQTCRLPPVLRLGGRLKFGKGNLCELLLATVDCEATDPRDKVYALLPFCQATITPDYTMASPQVFLQATSWSLITDQTLRILSLVSTPINGAPSWVPDFSPNDDSDAKRLPLASWRPVYRSLEPFPRSSRYERFTQPHQSIKLLSKTTLLVYGYKIDTVSETINFRPRGDWGYQIEVPDAELSSLLFLNSELSRRCFIRNQRELYPVLTHCVCDPEAQYQSLEIDLLAIDLLAPTFEQNNYFKGIAQGDRLKLCKSRVHYLLWLLNTFSGGRIFLITNHFVGVGPCHAEEGDMVFQLSGADNPFVIRKCEGGYTIIGECLLVTYPDRSDHFICDGIFYRP
jgi:hypothetical protein